MDNLEYIDNYFKGVLSPEERIDFERKLNQDPVLAEDMAFYLSAIDAGNELLKNEKISKFRTYYSEYLESNKNQKDQRAKVVSLWPRIAAVAAVFAAVLLAWFIWIKPDPPKLMADKYMLDNFQTLSVSMGTTEDTIQKGLRLYNEGKQEEALQIFEELAKTDTASSDAKKFAGIVSLRLGQYDKAISYFTALARNSLYGNPGKFYHAITLMKRNQPGDKQQAKALLQQVVDEDLDEKEVAREWLRKW